MKVAEINALDFGSTGNIMLNIARVAQENGIEVYTFSSSRQSLKKSVSNHVYIDKYIDYRTHMVLGMLTGNETAFSYLATKKLIKKLKAVSPDIIHLHNTHGWYLNHKLLFDYIKQADVKVIWTLHDCWTFTGRCPYFSLADCNKWKSGCHHCRYSGKQYPASYIFDKSKSQWGKKKKMFTGVDNMTLVTPSEWLAKLVGESYLKEYPVKVINNGIDLDLFKPTESDIRKKYNCQDKIIVLGVAFGWGVRKGLDVFIDLSKNLPNKYQIVLVGTNDEVDGSLPKNIISVHRTQNQTELAQFYTAANVFVNPTREDNFPTVNMESLACGTPVITFRTGGSSEILNDLCGSVVECNDVDALEKEIIRVCETKPYKKDDCINRAHEFDKDDKFAEYARLYEDINKN